MGVLVEEKYGAFTAATMAKMHEGEIQDARPPSRKKR
jgi:hypothetical protein